ncbi:MAG TPA: choice-of-anchor tandem repeat GloVer-containing protein [Rhizomicrobium sp.]
MFKLAPDGTLAVLHEFTGGSDGGFPVDGLIADGSGNLYGMTASGGIGDCVDGTLVGCGIAFKFTPDGTETVLYSFDDNNNGGYYPSDGPLLLDKHGNLYGTNFYGGANGNGTIFEIKN